VAALADDIAYNNHDLHDGLRAGLFTDVQAAQLPIVGPAFSEVDHNYNTLDSHRRRHEALRRVFGAMVEDVISTSHHLLAQSGAQSTQAIRDLDHPVIQFSFQFWQNLKEIRTFLFENMYRAPRVIEQREHAAKVVRDLFDIFMNTPNFMPKDWGGAVLADSSDLKKARVVADYIAGMTDRFAQQERDRLHRAR
jgi:dGTPase